MLIRELLSDEHRDYGCSGSSTTTRQAAPAPARLPGARRVRHARGARARAGRRRGHRQRARHPRRQAAGARGPLRRERHRALEAALPARAARRLVRAAAGTRMAQDDSARRQRRPTTWRSTENVVHGDFYGADYYRYPDSNDESAIYYDDSEDKRTMSGLLVTSFGPRRSLEVGCATGLMVKAMRAYGVEADGFDFSHWCIEHASDQVREWVRWDDVLKLAPPERPYDLVLALDVLEHLPPEQVPVALANIAASTAPGGIVFSVIPAYGPNEYGPEIFKLESTRGSATRRWAFRSSTCRSTTRGARTSGTSRTRPSAGGSRRSRAPGCCASARRTAAARALRRGRAVRAAIVLRVREGRAPGTVAREPAPALAHRRRARPAARILGLGAVGRRMPGCTGRRRRPGSRSRRTAARPARLRPLQPPGHRRRPGHRDLLGGRWAIARRRVHAITTGTRSISRCRAAGSSASA
jgi:SAM-dependent methyltransferase